MSWPAVEQLLFEVPAAQLDNFFKADAMSWTPFLEKQDGFGGKMQLFNYSSTWPGSGIDNDGDSVIKVTTLIFWDSYSQWKAIPDDDLSQAYGEFAQEYGSAGPAPSAFPSNDGWQLYQNTSSSYSSSFPVGCVLSNTISPSMCTQLVDNSNSGSNANNLPDYVIGCFVVLSLLIVACAAYIQHLLRLRVQEKEIEGEGKGKGLLGSSHRSAL